jgi:hypothetical protein
MSGSSHILIVNSRKVTRPVFIIGAPHSGTEAIGGALKRSPGFHVTIGQRSVLHAVYAFARRPSAYAGRGSATATVLRDAFAHGWQLSAASCLECGTECRVVAGLAVGDVGPCAQERGLVRYGDASADLAYCAETLTAAFPDAQLIQVIRDCRDVVAAMLADPGVMAWFRPSFANLDEELPNPFFGVEDEQTRDVWPSLSPAGKCALRWRWTIRLAAELHHSLPGEQLKTIRYEEMVRDPRGTAAALSEFTGEKIVAPITGRRPGAKPGSWRRALTASQITDITQIAPEELRRLGYT